VYLTDHTDNLSPTTQLPERGLCHLVFKSTPTCMRDHVTFFVFLAISAIASLISWQNRDSISRWIAFFLWSVPLLTLISALTFQHTRYSLSTGDLELRRTIVPLAVCLALIAVPLHLVALSDYPFIAMGDQIRDSGLRAASLFYDRSRDMFHEDWSQTLFFATWMSFLASFWPSDVLLYRSAGAAIALATIFVLFFANVRWAGPLAAFVAASFATTNAAHLFFARAEPLISVSELLSALALPTCIATFSSEGARLRRTFALLGLLLGLSFLMHASARAPAAFALLVASVGVIYRRKRTLRAAISEMTSLLAIALLLAVAAAGPYLVKVTWRYLTTPGSASTVLHTPWSTLLGDVYSRYLKTFALFWGAPLRIHFPGQTLIPSVVALAVSAGVLYSLVRRTIGGIACVLVLVGTLLANSAVAPEFNAGHRVLAALPPICLLAGLGVSALVDLVALWGRSRWVYAMTVPALCLMPTFVSTALFFLSDQASQIEDARFRRRLYKTLRHIVEDEEVRAQIRAHPSFCLYSKEQSWITADLQTLHVSEFFQFFLPEQKFQAKPSAILKDQETIIVSPGCKEIDSAALTEQLFDCGGKPAWRCPGPDERMRVYLLQ
jgi:hypothetical protein